MTSQKKIFCKNRLNPQGNLPKHNQTALKSYLLGAEVIEKHFTLDKTLPGNDHYHAGDPDDFKMAVNIHLYAVNFWYILIGV